MRLPRCDLVISRETTISTTKATIISREASVLSRSLTTKASISIKATTNAIRLIISAIMPVNLGRVLGLELLQEVGDLLLGLNEDLAKVLTKVLVAVVVERSGLTLVADTSCSTDAVNVLGDTVMLS